MSLRATVFISSTYTDLQFDREVAASVVEEMGFDYQYLPERSVAGTGARDYLAAERRAHIVVYLISRPSPAVDEEIVQASERGMYVIPLARTTAVGPGETVISDVARRKLKGPRFVGTYRSLAELRSSLRSGLSEAVARLADDSRSLAEWGPASYSDAADAVSDTNERLGLVQSTSSLFLGPRLGRLEEERRFLRNVDSFASRLMGDAPRHKRSQRTPRRPDPDLLQVIHVYNEGNTLDALAGKGANDHPYAADRRAVIVDIYRPLAACGILWLVGVADDVSPILICDDSCDVGTRVADRVFFGRFAQFGASAATLWGALLELCHTHPAGDLDHFCSQLYSS